jgi:transposase-like protein
MRRETRSDSAELSSCPSPLAARPEPPDHALMATACCPVILLPRGWPVWVKSALLHTIGLARMALLDAQAGFENSPLPAARQAAENSRLREELAMRDEVIRILRSRMECIPPAQRPHYPPTERLAILKLRTRAGWNTAETADQFSLTPPTIASWMQRLDEEGPDALVQAPTPMNKYPDFVATIAQDLSKMQPELGKGRISNMLGRAGLHLSRTTIGRLRKRPVAPPKPPKPAAAKKSGKPTEVSKAQSDDATKAKTEEKMKPVRTIKSRYPHHTWHIDLTLLPVLGFWTA